LAALSLQPPIGSATIYKNWIDGWLAIKRRNENILISSFDVKPTNQATQWEAAR
jgi:hypothetical protein